MIDLGTQVRTYKGQEKKLRQVLIGWELPSEKMNDGRSMSVAKFYTFSASKKGHLRADLESWRAKAYSDEEIAGVDLSKLIGQPAFLTITVNESDGRTYTNVDTVSKPPKGTTIPKMENAPQLLILTNEDFDKAAFEALSDGLKRIVEKSPEYQDLAAGREVGTHSDTSLDFDDEIPF